MRPQAGTNVARHGALLSAARQRDRVEGCESLLELRGELIATKIHGPSRGHSLKVRTFSQGLEHSAKVWPRYGRSAKVWRPTRGVDTSQIGI